MGSYNNFSLKDFFNSRLNHRDISYFSENRFIIQLESANGVKNFGDYLDVLFGVFTYILDEDHDIYLKNKTEFYLGLDAFRHVYHFVNIDIRLELKEMGEGDNVRDYYGWFEDSKLNKYWGVNLKDIKLCLDMFDTDGDLDMVIVDGSINYLDKISGLINGDYSSLDIMLEVLRVAVYLDIKGVIDSFIDTNI